jgi:hypothetical protein
MLKGPRLRTFHGLSKTRGDGHVWFRSVSYGLSVCVCQVLRSTEEYSYSFSWTASRLNRDRSFSTERTWAHARRVLVEELCSS